MLAASRDLLVFRFPTEGKNDLERGKGRLNSTELYVRMALIHLQKLCGPSVILGKGNAMSSSSSESYDFLETD